MMMTSSRLISVGAQCKYAVVRLSPLHTSPLSYVDIVVDNVLGLVETCNSSYKN